LLLTLLLPLLLLLTLLLPLLLLLTWPLTLLLLLTLAFEPKAQPPPTQPWKSGASAPRKPQEKPRLQPPRETKLPLRFRFQRKRNPFASMVHGTTRISKEAARETQDDRHHRRHPEGPRFHQRDEGSPIDTASGG
jgi:hypothetical protein